jgi:NAD(P)H-dependent flavin oxidoreductase YrpB (nitropropane dioxygenase family)
MKKLLILLIAFSNAALAQSNEEDIDYIQSIYGKEKKMIVADFIRLEGTQKDAFWQLYDEYEGKRKALGKRRVALLEKYAQDYETMDDATASEVIKETAGLAAETDKLVFTYFKKMEKVAGSRAAAQFYELEVYFLSAIRLAILKNIPFIGELK